MSQVPGHGEDPVSRLPNGSWRARFEPDVTSMESAPAESLTRGRRARSSTGSGGTSTSQARPYPGAKALDGGRVPRPLFAVWVTWCRIRVVSSQWVGAHYVTPRVDAKWLAALGPADFPRMVVKGSRSRMAEPEHSTPRQDAASVVPRERRCATGSGRGRARWRGEE